MQKIVEDEEAKEEEDEQGEEIEFHHIDILRDHGINQSDIQKLIDGGFMSIEAVFYSTKKKFMPNQRS